MARADDTPWLSSDELRAWMALNAMTETLPAALDAQLKRDSGLNLFDYYVLAALSEAPGRTLGMSHLALMAQSSPSRLSHAVARLERQGWVVRRPAPDDGRLTEAHLTAAGMRTVKAAAPAHVREARRRVLDTMTAAEFAELGRLARLVVDATAPEVGELLDDVARGR
jgi:DNA-binding MarR family transcriptional regulator